MTVRQHRIPQVFWPFAALTMFGPLPIMLLQHDPIHTTPAALAFVVILLLAVARGSLTSWTLLLLWNLFLISAIAMTLSHLEGITVGAPLLPLLGLTCATMQLTSSMRRHIGLGSREDNGRQAVAPL